MWMLETVPDRFQRIRSEIRPVHRLKIEPFKIQIHKLLGRGIFLRIHELELISLFYDEIGAGLWTHAGPIYAVRRLNRTICLDCNLKPSFVKRFDERGVKLEQRLATRTHDQRL